MHQMQLKKHQLEQDGKIQHKLLHMVFIMIFIHIIISIVSINNLTCTGLKYIATLILIAGQKEINEENLGKLLSAAKCEVDSKIPKVHQTEMKMI